MNEIVKNDMNGKEQVISQMYTLRAGLSVVSQEKDKAQKKFDASINKRNKNLKKAYEKQCGAEKAVEQAKKDFNAAIKNRESNERTANSAHKSNIKKAAFMLNMSRILLSATVILELVFFALFVWSIIFLVVYFDGFGKEWIEQDWLKTLYGWAYGEGGRESSRSAALFWLAPLGSIGLNVFGGFLIKKSLFVVGCRNYRLKDEIKKSNEKSRKKTKAIENLQKFAQEEMEAQQLIKVREDEYALACDCYAKECDEINAKYDEEQQKALKHVYAGMDMLEALSKTFSKQLDVRDWENIDLVIYYLETGRADSIKEALQLTDREKQTSRIETAMNKATEEITRQIVDGINYLQDYIGNCTKLLSDQVTNCAVATITRLASLESEVISNNYKMDSLSSYMSQLSSQTNMNNALRAKANESSAKLAEDVHQLRLLAESK